MPTARAPELAHAKLAATTALAVLAAREPGPGIRGTRAPTGRRGEAPQMRVVPRSSAMGRAVVAAGCLLAFGCGSGGAGEVRPASAPPPAAAPAADLAVTHATVIDGTGAPARTGMTILIADGLVTAVGADAELPPPAGATVLDATGKTVIPGLADMHVHFSSGGLAPAESLDRLLRQFLFYGVTTVLNLGATRGTPEDILALRADPASLHPHVYGTGGLLTVPGSHPIGTIMHLREGEDPATFDWSRRGVRVVRDAEELRSVVARLADAGMDGIKIVVESGPPPFGDHHPQMPPEMIAAAVDEAARHDLPVFAHASSLDELEAVVDAGVRAAVHVVRDPELPGEALLARMARQGTWYVPTLSLFVWTGTWGEPSESLTDPFLTGGVERGVLDSLLGSLVPREPPGEDDRAHRRKVLRGLREAHDHGVRIAAGTDTGNPFVFPGHSIHWELELMVEAGLTPMEALVAATRAAAEMLGEEEAFGTLAPGRRADLLILRENPLDDIRNTRTLETVVLAGRPLDRDALLPAE
jgi:imidazolonepropionase-like amidohydrolase